MGNCQAIDNSTIVIQHPNGKVENLFCPVSAGQIMKLNPGHYVALLLTTTLYSSSESVPAVPAVAAVAAAGGPKNSTAVDNKKAPLRITRIKLLRPTDTLVLGHVYRLVTTQEVMKGLWAKKQARMKQQQQSGYTEKYMKMTDDEISDYEEIVRKNDVEKTKQVKHERLRSRNNNTAVVVNSGASKSRGAWQPSLNSISEAGS